MFCFCNKRSFVDAADILQQPSSADYWKAIARNGNLFASSSLCDMNTTAFVRRSMLREETGPIRGDRSYRVRKKWSRQGNGSWDIQKRRIEQSASNVETTSGSLRPATEKLKVRWPILFFFLSLTKIRLDATNARLSRLSDHWSKVLEYYSFRQKFQIYRPLKERNMLKDWRKLCRTLSITLSREQSVFARRFMIGLNYTRFRTRP